MYDPTPPPFGNVTGLWTQLENPSRLEHVRRLIGTTCEDQGLRHIKSPGDDLGHCYFQLATAAIAGDEVAFAWMATTRRPHLLKVGAALFRQDPSEWGAVCLEALHAALGKADLSAGRWLRLHIRRKLTGLVVRESKRHLQRSNVERCIDPRDLGRSAGSSELEEPHLDLSEALERALAGIEPVTREALREYAEGHRLVEIAERYGLSHDALRQRVSRAYRKLRIELAEFRL